MMMNKETDDKLLELTKMILTLNNVKTSLETKTNGYVDGDYIEDAVEYCGDAIEMLREAQEELFNNENE